MKLINTVSEQFISSCNITSFAYVKYMYMAKYYKKLWYNRKLVSIKDRIPSANADLPRQQVEHLSVATLCHKGLCNMFFFSKKQITTSIV